MCLLAGRLTRKLWAVTVQLCSVTSQARDATLLQSRRKRRRKQGRKLRKTKNTRSGGKGMCYSMWVSVCQSQQGRERHKNFILTKWKYEEWCVCFLGLVHLFTITIAITQIQQYNYYLKQTIHTWYIHANHKIKSYYSKSRMRVKWKKD